MYLPKTIEASPGIFLFASELLQKIRPSNNLGLMGIHHQLTTLLVDYKM